jgi:hypothetical protein
MTEKVPALTTQKAQGLGWGARASGDRPQTQAGRLQVSGWLLATGLTPVA